MIDYNNFLSNIFPFIYFFFQLKGPVHLIHSTVNLTKAAMCILAFLETWCAMDSVIVLVEKMKHNHVLQPHVPVTNLSVQIMCAFSEIGFVTMTMTVVMARMNLAIAVSWFLLCKGLIYNLKLYVKLDIGILYKVNVSSNVYSHYLVLSVDF